MTIVMFALHITIYDILAVEICMTMILTVGIGQDQWLKWFVRAGRAQCKKIELTKGSLFTIRPKGCHRGWM